MNIKHKIRIMWTRILWLPNRETRRSLFNEFCGWGTPMDTLRGMSERLHDYDDRLRRAYRGMDEWEKRAREAEFLNSYNKSKVDGLELALRDALSTYEGSDKIVTAERIEAWQAVLKG